MSKLAELLKRWPRATGLSVLGLLSGLGIYDAYPTMKLKYQRFTEKAIAVPDIPDLEVTYKFLPQYGPKFKVAQVFCRMCMYTGSRFRRRHDHIHVNAVLNSYSVFGL